jgi:hypothetical protein
MKSSDGGYRRCFHTRPASSRAASRM